MMGDWDVVKTKKIGEWDVVGSRPISAITGKQVPTSQENLAQAGNAMDEYGQFARSAGKEALIVAADIMAAKRAPQLVIPKYAGKAARIGRGLLNIGSRAAASGAGALGGSIVGQKLENPLEPVSMREAATQGILGASGEPALSMAGKSLKYLGKKSVEAFGAMTPTGDRLRRKAAEFARTKQDAILSGSKDRAVNYLRETGASDIVKDDVGEMIGDKLVSMKSGDVIYHDANKIIKDLSEATGGGKVNLRNTQMWIDGKVTELVNEGVTPRNAIAEVVKELGFSMGDAEGRTIRYLWWHGNLSPKDASNVMKKIWKSHKSDPDVIIEFKEPLKKAFMGDLDAAGAVGFQEATENADKIYREAMTFFKENPMAARAVQDMRGAKGTKYYENMPDRVVDFILTGNPKKIESLKSKIMGLEGGDKAVEGLELVYTQRLFDSALKEKATPAGGTVFKPGVFVDEIAKNERRIKALSGNLWTKLKAEADHYSSVSKDLDSLEVTDAWSIFQAWKTAYPKSHKVASIALKAGEATTKVAGKAGLHMGGRAVFMDNGE